MHACLLIPEILAHIFFDIYHHCAINYEDAALSRVCHSFKDIALDVLRTELDNLEPLFTCLPHDLWIRTPERKLIIRRPVTSADWAIFERYASRVRVLGNRQSDLFGGIDSEFVFAIMGCCSQSLLVPKLQVLCCRSYPRDLHLCMRYFLSPDLIYLCMLPQGDRFWTNTMTSVLSGLSRHSPRLKVVEFSFDCYHSEITSFKVIQPALCELTHLRKATFVLPCERDSSWLSHLVGLQELHINFAGFLRPTRSQVRISYLDKLSVALLNMDLHARLVAEWVVPCRQLELRCSTTDSAAVIARCLRMLDDHLLCDVLECLILNMPILFENEAIDKAFTLHTFVPLLRFSGLKEIEIATSCMSLLDDDALGSIVKFWPCLERLYLGCEHFWSTPPKITFRGLVTLLSTCPNLKGLGLAFDATKLNPPTAIGDVCNTNITTFQVGFSPIDQTLEVSTVLSAILPCLKQFFVEPSLFVEAPDRARREAKWREVSRYMTSTHSDAYLGTVLNVLDT
ncbi:hypothetical protein CY34DRAFT_811625 [Suillus luteus UH-Slu-Lm8-n1]|uniref:F-box domain-containing protein n=1 Tax=Suillus luteus UH-Slu-Lm8-n1 TaxID=930992 RepID=A0A0D0AD65_9AGAM|nr:hypothetical protein CY34DRAFT_811625 [Suillus luteus UH-Slu-Lm8-n1]